MLKYLSYVFLLLPLLLAASLIVWQGIPDALRDEDAALIEISTRAALEGEQWTGPYSRFGFNHPGPLYFYLLAPLYWLTKGSALSLNLTAILINLGCIAGMLTVVWRCANTWGALWFALILAHYLKYLGPALLSIWNPHVTVLAFLFAVCCFSAVAIGKSGYLPMAVLLASFVVQTHLGYLLAVLVTGTLALLLFGWSLLQQKRSKQPCNTSQLCNMITISGILVIILWALPYIEQMTTADGNFFRIAAFFLSAANDTFSWDETAREFVGVLSKYSLSVFDQSNALNPIIPRGAISWLLLLLVSGQIGLFAIAYRQARRQSQNYFTALALLGGGMYFAIFFSIKRIVGPPLDYLLLWMTPLGLLTWFVIGGALLQPLGSKMTQRLGRRFQKGSLCLIIAALAGISYVSAHTLFNESVALLDNRNASTKTKDFPQLAATTLNFLREQGQKDCLLRTIDRSLWPAQAGLALKMVKTGIQAVIDPQWPARYPPRFAPTFVPGGMLLFCGPDASKRLQTLNYLTEAAKMQDGSTIFWQSLTKGLEGTFLFAMLPTFAFKYEGFSLSDMLGEDSWRWLAARQATLSIPLTSGNAYTLTLTAMLVGQLQPLFVSFNGRQLTKLTFDQQGLWQAFVMRLPVEAVKPLNEIGFRYGAATAPENAKRGEGQGLSSVALQRMVLENISKNLSINKK